MSHVFLSYKREDEAHALRLVKALEREGLSVWWDRQLAAAESWHEGISQALDTAGCVVVLWSKGSVGPAGDFVRDEASRARKRGCLVPILIDRVDPPLGFGELQAIDLTRWRGGARDPFFRDVVGAVRAKLEGRAVPAATGPRRHLARRVFVSSAASLAIALFSAFGTNMLQLQDRVCTAAALTDACAAMGMGNRPSRAERLAWAGRPQESCPALREHLRRFPLGAYQAQAVTLLQSARPDTATVPVQIERVVELYARTSEVSFPNRADAEADAQRRAVSEAASSQLYCAARDPLEALDSTTLKEEEFDCRRTADGGWSCAVTVRVACHLARHQVTERCGPGS